MNLLRRVASLAHDVHRKWRAKFHSNPIAQLQFRSIPQGHSILEKIAKNHGNFEKCLLNVGVSPRFCKKVINAFPLKGEYDKVEAQFSARVELLHAINYGLITDEQTLKRSLLIPPIKAFAGEKHPSIHFLSTLVPALREKNIISDSESAWLKNKGLYTNLLSALEDANQHGKLDFVQGCLTEAVRAEIVKSQEVIGSLLSKINSFHNEMQIKYRGKITGPMGSRAFLPLTTLSSFMRQGAITSFQELDYYTTAVRGVNWNSEKMHLFYANLIASGHLVTFENLKKVLYELKVDAYQYG
ncbi:MAG TPA: hypothetical protein VJG83_05760 [archaeon]|nr:hypothetical protein [archaeon]